MARPAKGTKRKAAGAEADATQAQPSPNQKKLPVRAKDDDVAPESEVSAKLVAKPTLKVFDDDDDDDEEDLVPVSATAPSAIEKPAPPPQPVDDDESDDDDDAAPEAVSTQRTASVVKQSTQAAQKAAQEYVPTHFSISCRLQRASFLTVTQASCSAETQTPTAGCPLQAAGRRAQKSRGGRRDVRRCSTAPRGSHRQEAGE